MLKKIIIDLNNASELNKIETIDKLNKNHIICNILLLFTFILSLYIASIFINTKMWLIVTWCLLLFGYFLALTMIKIIYLIVLKLIKEENIFKEVKNEISNKET